MAFPAMYCEIASKTQTREKISVYNQYEYNRYRYKENEI